MRDERRLHLHLRFVIREAPEFLACQRIVTTNVSPAVGYEFDTVLALINCGRGPRRDLVAFDTPRLFAVFQVERRDERLLVTIRLHEHEIAIDDRTARVSPRRIFVVPKTGMQNTEILLPLQLAVHVVTSKTFGTKQRHNITAVRDGS